MFKSLHMCVALALCAICRPLTGAAEEWETLEGCRLVASDYNDGDSFHVTHRGEEYIFRLYFVDSPESSQQIPSRVAEQAEVFGVDEKRILQAGREAAEFTAEKLGRPFAVRTQWQDAEGQSRLRRSYAFVETSDGRDLGEMLAAAGYARSYGAAAAPPGKNEQNLRGVYDRLADRARAARFGAWGQGRPGNSVALEQGDPPEQGEAEDTGVIPALPAMDSMLNSQQIAPEPP